MRVDTEFEENFKGWWHSSAIQWKTRSIYYQTTELVIRNAFYILRHNSPISLFQKAVPIGEYFLNSAVRDVRPRAGHLSRSAGEFEPRSEISAETRRSAQREGHSEMRGHHTAHIRRDS
ncbi:hypothetical protein CEXT_81551 [Caerostris extrusa]|uniref:Uncharacterized protein n=1 Tax=Caerostris extrusa TaxID=172846 RepID=A0AAV4TTM2_CAEEX|nr:hypothetical protein CEXT_81551 [Caerostris extrusa]